MKNTLDNMRQIEAKLQKISNIYNLQGDNLKVEPIDGGFAYPTYKIIAPNTSYFLKDLTTAIKTELHKTVDVYEELDRHNFPTSLPMRNTSGELLSSIDGSRLMLFEFIDIVEPKISDQLLFEVGSLMAKLHLLDASDNVLRHGSTCRPEFILEAYARLDETQKQSFPNIEILKELSDALPSGLVHSDVCTDNLLAASGHPLALIDFEESGKGIYVCDIAEAMVQLCFEGSDNVHKIETLLRGYATRRTLKRYEIESLYEGLLMGSMVRNIWWVQQPKSATRDQKIADRLSIEGQIVSIGKDDITRIAEEIFS